MIAVETNVGSPEFHRSRPALEIRFEFVDSEETFIQPDPACVNDFMTMANRQTSAIF
jgi:hypothetical protein